MAKAEYTETICFKCTKEQKEYFEKQYPNPSKWIRSLINKQRENDS